LDSDNDEILVDNGLTLGHLSLDEIEGAYFLKFSMLKILKISKDFTTIVFMVAPGKILTMQIEYSQLMLGLQF
jgi:hypothetical protein